MPTASGRVTAAEMRQLRALITAQAAIRDQLSATAVTAVQRAFAAIDDYQDPKQTGAAVRASVSVVQAQQRRMAQVTDAYMARSTSIITGRRYNPAGAVDVSKLRRELPQEIVETLARAKTTPEGEGPALTASERAAVARAQAAVKAADPEQAYGRIADAYRYRVASKQMDDATARRYVAQRAEVVADTDVMLADRAQSSRFLTERKPNGARGYRRVLNPEMGSGKPPCGLCVVAANQIYSFEELMPIHSRCRCTVTAVGSNDDPGFRLNTEDLKKLYKAAGGTGGRGLKLIRAEVVEHGELGPWLVNPAQRFRGPREVSKTKSDDLEIRTMAQLETLQSDLDVLLAQQASGMDVDDRVKWHRFKVRELSARLP